MSRSSEAIGNDGVMDCDFLERFGVESLTVCCVESLRSPIYRVIDYTRVTKRLRGNAVLAVFRCARLIRTCATSANNGSALPATSSTKKIRMVKGQHSRCRSSQHDDAVDFLQK